MAHIIYCRITRNKGCIGTSLVPIAVEVGVPPFGVVPAATIRPTCSDATDDRDDNIIYHLGFILVRQHRGIW